MSEPKNLHLIPELQEIKVSEGVKLRPLIQSDAEQILKILDNEPEIRKRVTVASKLYKPEDVAAEIERYTNDASLIRYVMLKEGLPIGMVSLWRDEGYFGAVPNLDDYGFGYFLDPKERGKGLVSRAIQSLMDVLNKTLVVKRFAAFCEDGNEQSIAVLTKLGFKATDETYPEPIHGWIERKYLKSAS